MILAKEAKRPHICLVFDQPQNKLWQVANKVTPEGIIALLQRFQDAGINLTEEVSAICLSDVISPKAADFKSKAEYCREFIETKGFNVLVPVGAKAFELVVGFKGIEKFLGKALESNVYSGCKVVPCPNPGMIKYKPEIKETLIEVAALCAVEKDYPDLRIVEAEPVDYVIVDTVDKLKALVAELEKAPVIAVDTETTGFMFNKHKVLTIQFSYKTHQSALIPTTFYKNPDGSNKYWSDKQWESICKKLRDIFARKDCVFIGQNLKFDQKFLHAEVGMEIQEPENTCDTMVMSFLVDENSPNDLKTLACKYTDLGDYEFELDQWKKAYCKENKVKAKDFSYAYIPFEILAPYGLKDTDATIRLYYHFLPLIEKEQQENVLKMLMEFSYTAVHMELSGWPIDEAYAQKYLIELTEKIEKAEEELQKDANVVIAQRIVEDLELKKVNSKRKTPLEKLNKEYKFNFKSTNHKRVLFFDVMRLPVVKYTKTRDANGKRTTPSTDKESIDSWGFKNPQYAEFFEKLQTLSELHKMRSTYVIGILSKVVNGRVHPTYKITGTKTGRLSSADPNYQNLPVRNKEAKNVKRMVRVQEDSDRVIIGADLQAAEMRGACIYSGDPRLIEIFQNRLDIHGAICKQVFGLECAANDVKKHFKELRDIAKTIQFLSLYGGGPETLASKVKITPDRSMQILDQICEELGLLTNGTPDHSQLRGNAGAALKLSNLFQFPLEKSAAVLLSQDKQSALMSAFEISVERAQEILDKYFSDYSGVNTFIESTKEFTNINGYSLSLLGRKRRVPEVNAEDQGAKERAIRQAVNSTIQSFSSDCLMCSAFLLLKEIKKRGWEDLVLILGVIHDALYIEAPRSIAEEVKNVMLECMVKFPPSINSPIPMEADAEWGEDWAHFSENFDDLYSDLRENEEDEEEEEAEAA